ncbi:hypothetical protein JOC85_003632 [Bacillus mesophilus]|uniref:Uncharacterized protein n=1 Tax=Bacillus mesophilus TaxID=1808955 RepID=A0A6M0QAJ3_9BACI|nr:hypothetical protein [Bacillus mesophilus]MBM7662821.1 hypothetical protein [Bacillus mesophilus]NEY73411.1 hypothetical protein [Bacillus mesophilus]
MKMIKMIVGFIVSVFLGLLFMGGLDIEDIKFSRNIRKLKKESWFKELSDNGIYYEKIYQNPKVREYLCQEHIVEKVINNEQERTYLISLLK